MIEIFYKPEIRERLNHRRKQLDPVSKKEAAESVATQVIQLSCFLESKHIAAYVAIEGELDPKPILKAAATLKKNLYLPALPNDRKAVAQVLQFYSYQLTDSLTINRLRIAEPDRYTQTFKPAMDLDLVILPLVAFDPKCNRLGRGAGHYDRTFAFIQNATHKKPFLLGIGYEFQLIQKIKPSPWDIPLNMIITEQNIYAV